MSVLISKSLQSNKTANTNYKTAKSNTSVVQQGVPYHNYRLEKTDSVLGNITCVTDEQLHSYSV